MEPPKDEAWHSVVRMELANNKLSELPLSPSSLELQVLMLQGNADLTRVPNTFFFKIPLLTVLDLSHTSLRELPDSLFELEHLRELYLKGCERFMKLSPKIGKLKSLETLDLDGTRIIHLPEEIQELTNLQSLFLCFYEYRGRKGKQYTRSTIIPSEVISKLKGLKHLSIDVNPDDERWYENVWDILPKILALEHLQTLSLYIPHLELLKFIPDRILWDDFRLIVGRHMQRIISSTPSTIEAKFKQCGSSLKFVNGEDVPDEIKRLVRHSKAFFLERHKTIKHLSEFKMINLEQLRVCMLAECREMQTIVDGRQSNRGNDIFSHLLYLYVSHMKSLRSVWEGVKPHRSLFGLLKSLVLQNCPELTTVFTMDFLGNLSLLKELIVKDCPKVTTLISDGSSKGEIFLPKLRKIMLLHLPELVTISNGCYIAPILNGMSVYDCPKVQSVSKSELSSQTLKFIKGEIKWWDQLQWSEEEWGTSQRPSKFDRIFSSIDNQVDIMTQVGNDGDDIDDDADYMMPPETLFVPLKQNANAFDSCKMSSNTCSQASSVTDSITQRGNAMDKQVNIITQIGNDGDDINDDAADMAPSQTLFENPKQNADSFSRRAKKDAERFTFRTKSEVDILEDGYKWKKYGVKMTRWSNPRGYYKCTHEGCPVRKSVQRSTDDPTMVETVYEGIHTHPRPQENRSLHKLQSSAMVSSENQYPSNDKVDEERSYMHTMMADLGNYVWGKQEEEVMDAVIYYDPCSCKTSSDTCSQASCVTDSIIQRGNAMDNQVDIMTQIGNDGDDIDDDADYMMPPKTLFGPLKQNADAFRSCKTSSDTCSQASCVTDSINGNAMDNQVDIITQIGNDGDDIDDDADMAPPQTLFENSKQNGDSFSGRAKKNAKRFAFRTKSEVDILDDGYRWRKYGKKTTGCSNPRSYYKCTHEGCSAKKKVERSADDGTIVETVYKGKHMHPRSQDNRSLHKPYSSEITVSSETQYPTNDKVDEETSYMHTVSKKSHKIRKPRPLPPLSVSKESHMIRKPPLPPQAHQLAVGPSKRQQLQPVIIYSMSPKVIHVPVDDFMKVVHRLTGPSSPSSRSGDVSPAARLVSIEKTSPSEKDRSGNVSPAARLESIEKTNPPAARLMSIEKTSPSEKKRFQSGLAMR